MRTSTSAFGVALATLVLAGSTAFGQQTRSLAQVHLEKARTLLEGVPASSLSADKDDNEDAAEELAKLRRQFDELVQGFGASPESSSDTGWKLKFSEIERTLSRIIGGGSLVGPMKAGAAVVVQPTRPNPTSTPGLVEVPAGGVPTTASNPATGTPSVVPNSVPPTAGTVVTTPQTAGAATTDTATVPAPVGTSGSTAAAGAPVGTSGTTGGAAVSGDAAAVAAAKVSTIGFKRLNPDVRRQLELFRTEIELFYVAPVGERSPGTP